MRLGLLLTLTLLASCASLEKDARTPLPPGAIEVLGVAQDGGRPQLGCTAACCRDLAPAAASSVTALAAMGEEGWLLVDATPDLPAQVRSIGSLPDAVLLTHAHIGHYLGLAFLGREALGADGMPVWCSARMASFLREHGPWSQLVALGNIKLHVFEEGEAFEPVPGVVTRAYAVPHRDEFSDTHGFSFHLGSTSLFFLPDIDEWETWPLLQEMAAGHRILLLDGTFNDDQELPGRDMSRIPHPRVPDTMDRLQTKVDAGLEVLFLHLNHTNPLWDPASPETRALRSRGFDVAVRGQRLGGEAPEGKR